MIQHTVEDGKYTIIFEDSGKMHALRYGQPWRDLTGDGMVLAMLQEIDELKEANTQLIQDNVNLAEQVDILMDEANKDLHTPKPTKPSSDNTDNVVIAIWVAALTLILLSQK